MDNEDIFGKLSEGINSYALIAAILKKQNGIEWILSNANKEQNE